MPKKIKMPQADSIVITKHAMIQFKKRVCSLPLNEIGEFMQKAVANGKVLKANSNCLYRGDKCLT